MTLRTDSTLVAYLYVTDRARALDFYCGKLGLSHHSADEHGDCLAIDSALIRMTVIPEKAGSAHPVLGWEVADIVKTVRALRDDGVPMTVYDGMGQDDLGLWTSPDGAAILAWFADPDGNALSLSQIRR